MVKACEYRLPDQGGTMTCGQDVTHVCLCESDENPARTDVEQRCAYHAKTPDVVDAWTNVEADAWEL